MDRYVPPVGFGSKRPFRRQLAVGGLVAVILPWLAVRALNAPEGLALSQQLTLAGTTAALLLGSYLFTAFINYPGVQAGLFSLPSFATSYGIVLAAFFMARFDYSRLQFAVSFVAALIWCLFTFVVIRRRQAPRLGVLPAGEASAVMTLPRIEWIEVRPERIAAMPQLDGIVADLRADMPAEWERFLADCALSGLPVYHFKYIVESLTGTVRIDHISENTFGTLIPALAYVRVKQAIDIAAAAFVGLILLPPLLLVALAIRLDSPGPALFRQIRIGRGGLPFVVFKFRTMRHQPPVESEEEGRLAAITQADDNRITRHGAWLRRSRIDELPQIWNVLRGEMSWIGPRPEAATLSRWYEREIPFYRYRHIVRPGITGWAQVNQGHVHSVEDILAKLTYDFYYVKYFSPSLDLLIALRTVRTMLTGFGSR